MKAQISRNSHRPTRHYSGVYQQQGRMITDADWNELMDVVKLRQEQAFARSVGSGVPRSGGVLAVTDARTSTNPGRFTTSAALQWGGVFVDGISAEVVGATDAGASFDYTKQLDFPEPPAQPAAPVTFYVDVWERLVVAFEDAGLLDSALHGADTCVRTQVLAQVKCASNPAQITDPDLNPASGNAVFRLERPANSTDAGDPCAAEVSIARELGNYLFRLEVHDVTGAANAPSEVILKWSSENAAEAHAVGTEPTEFRRGEWVYEFFSDVTERHLGVHLAGGGVQRGQLQKAGYPGQIPLDPHAKPLPFVRRWDGYCILHQSGAGWSFVEGKHLGQAILSTPDPISGGRLELQLEALVLHLECASKRFVAGDYWLALLREHPEGAPPNVLSSTPVGVVHHYLRLLTTNGGATVYPADSPAVRQLSFPRLTDISATRVSYDPTVATSRWTDINEDSGHAPTTVQDAIDQLAANLEASDLAYTLPGCPGVTVQQLLQSVPHWPDLDESGRTTVKDMFDALLCHLDASRIPYSAGAGDTIKAYLDQLRTDVDARVKIAGDTMTGNLIVNAQIGINEATPGGSLTITGGHRTKQHRSSASIEIEHVGRGTSVLQADSKDGPFRICVADGFSRVSQLWNAYGETGRHHYDVNQPAMWFRTGLAAGDGGFAFYTAPAGTADAVVPWNLGVCQLASGAVGIATHAPSSELEVNGTATMKGFHMPPGGSLGLVLTSDAQGVGTWQRPTWSGWRVEGEHVLSDVSGNVGIGVKAPPQAKLHVGGSTLLEGALTVTGPLTPSVGNTENFGIMFPKDPGDGSGDAAWIRYYARAGQSTTFEIGTSNNGDDHIALMASGGVGVGTTAPDAKFHVAGQVLVTGGAITPAVGDSESAGIMFPKDPGSGSGDAAWIRYYPRPHAGEATTFEIGTSNDGDDHIALMASGNVGVGRGDPQAKLHVMGDYVRVNGVGGEDAYLGGDGAGNDVQVGSFRNNVTSVSFWNQSRGELMDIHHRNQFGFSDLRAKTDVKKVSGASEKIGRLRGVQFKWKNAQSDTEHAKPRLGFIAQEVEDVVPEAVTRGRDGTYLMSYDAIVPLLVEAMKEQQSAISALEEKVLELSQKLAQRK